MITAHYRADYIGEEIVLERKLEDGAWKTLSDYVPSQITNETTAPAIVIGNGPSRLSFNLNHLKKNTLQTYGCNALYRDFAPNFLVVTNTLAQEITDSEYIHNNIVYADVTTLIKNPQQFYLIPYNPYIDTGTTAAYIAAFDGHPKIYLMGFDGQDTSGFNYNVYADTNGYNNKSETIDDAKWIENRRELCFAYPEVDFVWVTSNGKHTMPERLKHCHNLRQISHRGLVLECDL